MVQICILTELTHTTYDIAWVEQMLWNTSATIYMKVRADKRNAACAKLITRPSMRYGKQQRRIQE